MVRQRGWPGTMGFPESVILTPHTEMSSKYMVEISRGCPCVCRLLLGGVQLPSRPWLHPGRARGPGPGHIGVQPQSTAAIACEEFGAVCGDTTLWKPSPHAPLTAIAVQNIVNDVMARNSLSGIFNLCIGAGKAAGQWMAEDRRLPLISATGSCAMGRSVSQAVSARLGRSLLELGGNNGAIITSNIDGSMWPNWIDPYS